MERLEGKLGLLRAALVGGWAGKQGAPSLQLRARVRVCVHGAGVQELWVWAGGVGKEMSWVMKTTVMDKGRGDTGSEMWNQVLLGNGRVKEQWWWPASSHPCSLQVLLPPHILCHSALVS